MKNRSMKADISAGNKRYGVKLSFVAIVAGHAWPTLALAASPVDQIERLMSEQQALQSHHTQQLQSLRQQLDEQALVNQTQDWQLAGGFMAALLMALAAAWLFTRWPAWQQAWQARREAKAVPEPVPAIIHRDAADFQSSGLAGGGVVDASGPGILANLVRKRKQLSSAKAPAVDSEWLAQLDELDSQFLADDALREYELRKTVGLSRDQDDVLQQERAASKPCDQSAEAIWQAMQEVSLDLDPAVSEEAISVDVGAEVQRVRKALQERRHQRALHQLHNSEANAAQELADHLDFEFPAPAPEESDETDSAQVAQVPELIQSAAEPSAKPTPEASTPEGALPAQELVLSYVQEVPDSFSPSVRAMSDAETRLALAQEFEKLGQLDEAATLCEEVLATGTAAEQFRARQVLSSMPGR
jgi:hypothetical protein